MCSLSSDPYRASINHLLLNREMYSPDIHMALLLYFKIYQLIPTSASARAVSDTSSFNSSMKRSQQTRDRWVGTAGSDIAGLESVHEDSCSEGTQETDTTASLGSKLDCRAIFTYPSSEAPSSAFCCFLVLVCGAGVEPRAFHRLS